MKYYTLTAKGELFSKLNVNETRNLLQLLRILNALRYHMNLLKKYSTNRLTIYSTYNKLEETYILASIIKESIKELFGNGKVIDDLSNIITDNSIKCACNDKKKYYDQYKTNTDLMFLDYLRNTFSFHFSKEIYDDIISDGENKKDVIVGISKSYKNGDMFYSIINDIMLMKIEEYIHKHNIDKKVEEYLFDVVYGEAISIYKFTNKVAASICKGYMKKIKTAF
jgi:hypothetical protein